MAGDNFSKIYDNLAVAPPARPADLLDVVKARGTLPVALEGTYPPFNFKDGKTGRMAGYDVDVATLVCARLGVRPAFVTMEWAGITPRRLRAFDFSQPYTYSAPQLIVRRNEDANYRSLADLKGRTVGVGHGSVFEQQVRAVPGIDVKRYPAAPENLQDLAFGRIDVALNDSLMVPYLLKNSGLPIRAGARLAKNETADRAAVLTVTCSGSSARRRLPA